MWFGAFIDVMIAEGGEPSVLGYFQTLSFVEISLLSSVELRGFYLCGPVQLYLAGQD